MKDDATFSNKMSFKVILHKNQGQGYVALEPIPHPPEKINKELYTSLQWFFFF